MFISRERHDMEDVDVHFDMSEVNDDRNMLLPGVMAAIHSQPRLNPAPLPHRQCSNTALTVYIM